MMKKFLTNRVRFRFVLLISVVIIPALTISLYTLQKDYQREMREQENSVRQLTNIIAVQEEDFFEATHRLLLVLAEHSLTHSTTIDHWKELLQRLSAKTSRYVNFGVADCNGNIIVSAHPLPSAVSIADRAYFQKALATKQFTVSNYIKDRISKKNSIVFTLPIFDSNNSCRGVAFAAMDLDRFSLLEERIAKLLPEGSTLTKIDSEGTILSRYPAKSGVIGTVDHQLYPIISSLATKKEQTQWATDTTGQKFLFTMAEVYNREVPLGISVVVGIPEEVAFRDIELIYRSNLETILLLVIIIFVVGGVANELFIVRGLTHLVEVSEKVRRGNYQIRVKDLKGVREIKYLALAFNNMVKALAEREQERARSEEILRQSEEKYRNIVTWAPVGIYQSTPEGNFLSVNQRLVEILGYDSIDELMNRNLEQDVYFNPSDRRKAIDTYAGQGSVFNLEVCWKKKDGAPLWIELSSHAVKDAEGNILYFEGFVNDISSRKRLEKQLIKSQKLESIGTLAGGIAHDFNNILGIILGSIALLHRYKNDDKLFNNSVHTIEKVVERGSSLVRQMLTFARQTETKLEPMQINTTVREVVKLLHEVFPKTIEINAVYDDDLPEIIADTTQIHQVLLNLSVNARDAMPNGGSLTITTSRVSGPIVKEKYPSATKDDYIKIEVNDTGIGMDESVRARIFEPFFTTKEIGKGTGLGLSIVFGIIQAHEGIIDVVSEVGKGTTFYIYLPVEKKEVEQLEPQKVQTTELQGTETILVIEDEEMLSEMAKITLESYGYTVFTASDGASAIELFKNHHQIIDLVFSDLGLPGISGKDVMKQLKDLKPMVKTLIASGYLEPNLKSELMKLGFQNYLSKPYIPIDLVKKIRQTLDAT